MSALPSIEIPVRRIQSEPQLSSPANVRAPEQLRTPVVIESSPQLPNQASVPSSPTGGSTLTRVLAVFGFGRAATHQRKSLVSVIWNLAWGVSQITVITIVLILTGVLFKDPRNREVSEWRACSRPLGVWASLWIARVVLASGLAYWEFRRDRVLHPPPDTERANGSPRVQQSSASTPNGTITASPGNTSTPSAESPTLSNSILYSRLTLLSSLITLSWFLTAHVLAYTSIETCRHTSPHLWWLVFGIMCIMYLMILEVVVLGFVVLIIAPILFIFWNIILICLGRHPMQNPGVITPDVGKLSKAVVDKIPLAIYIPPPPSLDGLDAEKGSQTPHMYPPKPSDEKPVRTRFMLLRNLSSFASAKKRPREKVPDVDTANVTSPAWFDNWEKTEYPFVTLDGNRATCAICLMDFEEPKRKEDNKDNNKDEAKKEEEMKEIDKSKVSVTAELGGDNVDIYGTVSQVVDEAVVSAGGPTTVPNLPIPQEDSNRDLKLSDAGEGSQPLRLLECGHAFHKTCVDPWLTDVSGRCPVCQRPVVEPKGGKSQRG
ncbi:hypothetical protein CPB83DRAFT_868000 [Crepidotus variabilis]|uniref:RING-type domain-containing protein n=1 Tax=Crepidotus variabilis TaxID=179855 RepID=A0A9P6JT74_9AGAR|nr:hypothetical protein CPB83DRAFT_868000 [Crepidotus variabilis]